MSMKKINRDPFSKAKAWLSGQGKSDTARATRMDPEASMMKKMFVSTMMWGMEKVLKKPGKIQLSDKTKEMLQTVIDDGKQQDMLQAFETAINIGQGISSGLKNSEESAAQFRELTNKFPEIEELISHLAQSGEFVPAYNWISVKQNDEQTN